MIRLVYVVALSFPIVLHYILKSHYIVKHMDKYSEVQRYSMAQRMISIMQKNGRIITDVYGRENLPADGGYVMYPNHQGKYDALGIISAHETPCTFVIDEQRSHLPLAKEFTALLSASRLNKLNPKEQLKTILDVIHQVKDGRRFIIFPEGGYEDNKNSVADFLPGAFKCSIRSQTPIIPVALKDFYKVFGVNSLCKVRTEVHFLKPLYYEEYKNMSTIQIAELVKSRIEEVLGTAA